MLTELTEGPGGSSGDETRRRASSVALAAAVVVTGAAIAAGLAQLVDLLADPSVPPAFEEARRDLRRYRLFSVAVAANVALVAGCIWARLLVTAPPKRRSRVGLLLLAGSALYPLVTEATIGVWNSGRP